MTSSSVATFSVFEQKKRISPLLHWSFTIRKSGVLGGGGALRGPSEIEDMVGPAAGKRNVIVTLPPKTLPVVGTGLETAKRIRALFCLLVFCWTSWSYFLGFPTIFVSLCLPLFRDPLFHAVVYWQPRSMKREERWRLTGSHSVQFEFGVFFLEY